MTLLVSSAYAANTTFIDIKTNNQETVGSEDTEVDSERTAIDERRHSEAIKKSEAEESESSEQTSITVQPTTPLEPVEPIAPGSSRDDSDFKRGEQSVPISESGEGEAIVNKGSKDENDSNVRIRIRNRSDSELNREDVDSANSEFTLNIKENTSAD